MTTLYKKEIMAVSIDTVYQRVLSIANKEQRGYITPQEFNLLANQAQLEIFEQYFYDLNQFIRLPGNDTRHADMVTTLEEKIAIFEKENYYNITNGAVTLPSMYKLTSLSFINGTDYIEVERVSNKKLNLLRATPLTKPTVARPVYVQTSPTTAQMYPKASMTNVTVNYIAKPADVEWAYILGPNNEALFLADDKVDFELHVSEETNLVTKILELAGVVIKQPDLYQIADKEEIQTIQQEKQ